MELHQLKDAIIAGNAPEAKSLTDAALADGISPSTIVNDGLIVAMGVVGERFGRGEIYVPEMLLAARAMQTGLDILEPLLAGGGATSRGTVVLGTVKGDVHDIGKNVVAVMLKGSGFAIVDLGVDVPAERFVAAVHEHRPDILGMSALLTTTMPAMEKVIQALEAARIRNDVKVMVGGAPVTQEYADTIGADGYGRDAGSAAARAKELTSGVVAR